MEIYFSALVDLHSWSAVKIDRIGLQFFWQHVLKLDWHWIEMIKVPQVRVLPDILTLAEIERLIGATRHFGFGILRRYLRHPWRRALSRISAGDLFNGITLE